MTGSKLDWLIHFLDDRRIKESTGREQCLLSLPLFSGKIEGDSACRVHPLKWYNSLWLWKWLPNRLSKRQSVTTITDRNTFNRTIQFNLLLIMILIIMKSFGKIYYWNHVSNKICHFPPPPPPSPIFALWTREKDSLSSTKKNLPKTWLQWF